MADNAKPAPERIRGDRFSNALFAMEVRDGGIVSLKRPGDAFDTDYILAGARFGDVFVRYRVGGGPWREALTADLAPEAAAPPPQEGAAECAATYPLGGRERPDLDLTVRFAFEGDGLVWSLRLRNRTDQPIDLGDVALPFPMNSDYVWDKDETASRRVFRHSFVSGHASFMFWMRCNSVGPYLVMVPLGDTKLEYFDAAGRGEPCKGVYMAYIHSAVQGAVARQKGCTWRQPNTAGALSPRGRRGDERTYALKFLWADGYDAVRDALYREGKFDIHVVPGMVVPEDLFAMFSLRTRSPIRSVEAEHPGETQVEYLGVRGQDTHVYRARFSRLGENLVTVRYGDGHYLVLEFFVTEPVETLIRKRAAFLVAAQQHRDPAKWYDGLISDWNMSTRVRLGPDHLDRIKGWRKYMVSCDDPGLCKAPLVAAKNVEYPSRREIEAIDCYLTHFVWGGLQRTDTETYPYALYGIPDWKELRESPDDGPKGQRHVWRIYDYPHMVMLYLKMYEIATHYPEIRTCLAPDEYLRRAFGTARAFFTVPLAIEKWSAYQTGTYNEVVIPDLIDVLNARGWREEADGLRHHWQTKVRCFVKDNLNLFGSEYPFDSTGFESTHALARYAMERIVKGGGGGDGPCRDVAREDVEPFMERQTAANIMCRGWLEAAYYHLGSDFRGCGSSAYTLSYMSQMGGWSLLDYALYYARDPVPSLRLAYASILSSWALMNTGTPKSGYGYWYPGKENDGAAGGGFEPEPFGQTWLEQPHTRGAWYYGCEIDLGYGGALRAAATVVAEDPLFGLFAYGGELSQADGRIAVVPRDGVRRRFHVVRGRVRFHMLLGRDHFAAETPIVVRDDLSEIGFVLESAARSDHAARLTLSGLPAGRYVVRIDGQEVAAVTTDGGEIQVDLPVPADVRPSADARAADRGGAAGTGEANRGLPLALARANGTMGRPPLFLGDDSVREAVTRSVVITRERRT